MKHDRVQLLVLQYRDNVPTGFRKEKRVIYENKHGRYINDTLHGCKVYLISETPPTVRVDTYTVPCYVAAPHFLGLRFPGLRHGSFEDWSAKQ